MGQLIDSLAHEEQKDIVERLFSPQLKEQASYQQDNKLTDSLEKSSCVAHKGHLYILSHIAKDLERER
ncbi:MAG TPA: hypothetical protein VFJ51_06355 [Nitrososphaeraceae archaeon]|nr:hypothetical protein [Nitrososphaeraceae archaeon]